MYDTSVFPSFLPYFFSFSISPSSLSFSLSLFGHGDHKTQVVWIIATAAAAAELLQSCPTLCDPIDFYRPSITYNPELR